MRYLFSKLFQVFILALGIMGVVYSKQCIQNQESRNYLSSLRFKDEKGCSFSPRINNENDIYYNSESTSVGAIFMLDDKNSSDSCPLINK